MPGSLPKKEAIILNNDKCNNVLCVLSYKSSYRYDKKNKKQLRLD